MGSVDARIGPFEIRGEIGAGGMGVVYLGWDPRLGRSVAIKTLKPDLAADAHARRRFLSEARAVAAISHPNVIQIFDIGEQDGRVFFAMEHVEGRSLRQLLEERGRLAPREAIGFVRQAALGLKAAADCGVIHRDVKPSNLMVTAAGTLKVMDFGLAKQSLGDSQLSGPVDFAGTPDYIAPERASGEATTIASDVYSLGATLFELVTGRPPFQGSSPVSVIAKHLRQPPPGPRELNSEVPHPLNFLVLKMLSKQPESRPQTYDVLLHQLDRLPLSGSGDAPLKSVGASGSPGAESPSSSWVTRLVGAVVLVLALVGAWGLGKDDSRRPAATDPTEQGAVPEDGALGPGIVAPAVRRLQPGRADLTVTENRSEITPEGRWRVWGLVVNAGRGHAMNGRIRVAVVDDEGHEIVSVDAPLVPDTLAVGERAAFDVLLPAPERRGIIRLDLSWAS